MWYGHMIKSEVLDSYKWALLAMWYMCACKYIIMILNSTISA